MKELTILSGKGGTGKTSLVASFSALSGESVIADCDVDAADLHLVLDPRIERRAVFKGGYKASIDPALCNGCGECERVCRFDAVRGGGPAGPSAAETFAVDPLSCEGCGVCAYFCPTPAIAMEEQVQGEWFLSSTRHGPMVHARLGIAAENSGKLVSLIRAEAAKTAGEKGLDLVIVDGSPGIGCPVIASMTGCDLVLAVTEPTLSGLHDLKRVASLADHFKTPLLVAVNKYDLNEAVFREIGKWCEDKGVAMAGRIPYSGAFTKAMVAGLSVVEFAGGGSSRGDSDDSRTAAAAVKDIWTRTLAVLRDGEGADAEKET